MQPSSVTSIGSAAISVCGALKSVTIGKGVASIDEWAFAECGSLETITVAEENTFYQSIGNCLIETATKTLIAGCKNSVIPSDGSVTSIGRNAFNGCVGLQSIVIPDCVTSIEPQAFLGCSSLKSIVIPQSVTSIGNSVFYKCFSLESITLPFVGAMKNGTSNTHFGYIFGAGDDYHFNVSFVPSSLKEVIITGGTSIGSYAFLGCVSLTNIVIENSVTSVGSYAFQYCRNLTSIVIGNGVTNIGSYAFQDCRNLTSIVIGNGVTNIGSYAFDSCGILQSIEYQGTKAEWRAITKENYWNYNTGDYTVTCTDGTLGKWD